MFQGGPASAPAAKRYVMPKRKMKTASVLVAQLIAIFPAFESEWVEGQSQIDNGYYTFHAVFQAFAPNSARFLNEATPSRLHAFCKLVNSMVQSGCDLENAVSTWFLEHASQIGVRNIIKPCLSENARQELR